MTHTCPIASHRLYWAVTGQCPCIEPVVQDLVDMARHSSRGVDLCNKFFSKYPWMEPMVSRGFIISTFLDWIDRDLV